MLGWFKKKKQPSNILEQLIEAVYGPNATKTANLSDAITLAYQELLSGAFPHDEISRLAADLDRGPMPYSTHDLACAVALAILREVPLAGRPKLMQIQMTARLKVGEWLVEGKIAPVLAKIFEDALYKDYHPNQWT